MADADRAEKRLQSVLRGDDVHWVGDGFPVRTLFAYPQAGAALSPFLLLDYGGPVEFEPTSARRGVGEHPHRGFETVTIVYSGEVEHRDSSGGGGRIGPGDVQWMTAGAGLVHEEFHGRDYALRGGPFEMVQLWVNLPARHKMTPPHYQSILSEQIPQVTLPDGAGTVRVVAGELAGAKGPAATYTPVQVWDLRLASGRTAVLPLSEGHTTLLAVLRGAVRARDSEPIRAAQVAMFGRAGAQLHLAADSDTTALLLSGEPIDEPIVGQGPFVMNTVDEIRQAIADFRSGRMGVLG